MFKYSLGVKVQDTITKVQGVITGRYHTASIVRYEIAYVNASGSMIQDWIDEDRVELAS